MEPDDTAVVSQPSTTTTTKVDTTTTTLPATTTTSQPSTTTSEAELDFDLSNVVFEDHGLDPDLRQAMEDGVLALWRLLAPYLRDHGVADFPPARITGYPKAADVTGICGPVDGCAFPGRAYVSMESRFSITEAAHESAHLVQYALRGPVVTEPWWLSEGAAEWLAQKAVETHPIQQVTFEIVREDYRATMAVTEGLPALDELTSERGFTGTLSTIAYPVGFLAADLLIQLEGGHAAGINAYVTFLADANEMHWKDAFNSNFTVDFDAFTECFAEYVASDFATATCGE